MKAQTVINVLIAEGIEGHAILQRFTGAGLEMGVRVGPKIVSGLVPIDDESDVKFARAIARAAKKESVAQSSNKDGEKRS